MNRVDLIRSELSGVIMELEDVPQGFNSPVYVAQKRAENALRVFNEDQAARLADAIAAFRANTDLKRKFPRAEHHAWIERVLLPAVIK